MKEINIKYKDKKFFLYKQKDIILCITAIDDYHIFIDYNCKKRTIKKLIFIIEENE